MLVCVDPPSEHCRGAKTHTCGKVEARGRLILHLHVDYLHLPWCSVGVKSAVTARHHGGHGLGPCTAVNVLGGRLVFVRMYDCDATTMN